MMFNWLCYALIAFGAYLIVDGLLAGDGRVTYLFPIGLAFMIVGVFAKLPDKSRRGRSRRSSFSFWDIFDGSGSGGGSSGGFGGGD